MCGIAGMVAKNGSPDPERMEQMLELIQHRGPDNKGTFFEGPVALGHRRLAILDASSSGNQPMEYLGRYVVCFNGEIYNYLELREELCKKGYHFCTETDTEVIPAALDCWGKAAFSRFNGMWALCVYDRDRRELLCSRDRFGVKPFYYYNDTEMFVFGSEIKQLLPFISGGVRANRDELYVFLSQGVLDYSERTMFAQVFQLRPGQNLIYSIQERTIRLETWYDIAACKVEEIELTQEIKRFQECFFSSVALRLRADVPVGYCLSGGVDSSAIHCAAAQILKNQGVLNTQHTVSACYEDKRYDEREYIDAVIEKTGAQNHKVFPDLNQVFSELDAIVWHMDEPFGSTSVFAQWNVFREASAHGLKVMLDGQGSDEQLAGYTGFYVVRFATLARRLRFIQFFREIRQYCELRARSEPHKTWQMVLGALGYAYSPASVRRWLMKRFYGERSGKLFLGSRRARQIQVQLQSAYNFCDERAYVRAGLSIGMPGLLHYEDRNSMAFSIESRIPFLDVRLSEFAYGVPLGDKLKNGITKYILREALRGVMPDKVTDRFTKLGFATPEESWITDNKQAIRAELEKAVQRLGPLIDKEEAPRWIEKQFSQLRRGRFEIWRVICAAHWADVFNVTI